MSFFDKKRRIFNFTILKLVLWNYCKKLILPYNTRFYDVILTKTKVVPLRFFLKMYGFLKSILWTSILWEKINFGKKRKGTLVLVKKHHKIGYYRVKYFFWSIYIKLAIVVKNWIFDVFYQKTKNVLVTLRTQHRPQNQNGSLVGAISVSS